VTLRQPDFSMGERGPYALALTIWCTSRHARRGTETHNRPANHHE